MSTWLDTGRRWLGTVGDLLWPPVCATCSRLLPLVEAASPAEAGPPPSAHFCPDCLAEVEMLPEAACPACARPLYNSPGAHLCGDCLAAPPPYHTARSAAVYQGPVGHSIALLKYHGQLHQVRALADLARPALDGLLSHGRLESDAAPPDAVVPLPLSPKRLMERGFNQASLLARALFRSRPEMIDEKLLIRTSDGRHHQAALSRDERRKAIRGCFAVPAPEAVKGARLILFDDVLTTGATAGEAARVLLEAGAARVDLATVARTVLSSWR